MALWQIISWYYYLQQNHSVWLKGDTGQQTKHLAVCGEMSRQSFTGEMAIKWSGLVPSKEHNLSIGKTCKSGKPICPNPNLKFWCWPNSLSSLLLLIVHISFLSVFQIIWHGFIWRQLYNFIISLLILHCQTSLLPQPSLKELPKTCFFELSQ